jgi:hypothetical protein
MFHEGGCNGARTLDSGASYFTAFSLDVSDGRRFNHVREIVKICPRSATAYIEPVFSRRTPKSDGRWFPDPSGSARSAAGAFGFCAARASARQSRCNNRFLAIAAA